MSKRKPRPPKVRPQPKPTAVDVSPRWYERPLVLGGLLFIFGFLLYANTLGHGFTLDDAIVITENVITQRGPAAWGELFGHDTFYGFFQDEGKAKLVSGGRYRPLSLALFGLERSISTGPFLHHLFNLLWYGGLLILLYGFLLRVQRHRLPESSAFGLAFVATLLFAAHPLHTEVVANIKGRDEIMALVGSIGAAWLVWRATDQQRWQPAILAAVVFFLGLLSKETTITFLAVIPLLLFTLRRDYKHRMQLYVLPLVGAAAVFLLIRASVLGGGGDGSPVLELMNNPFLKLEGGRWVPFDFAEWSATVVYGLGKYLQLLFAPIQLSHDYYPRAFGTPRWSDVSVIAALLVNVVIFLYGFSQLRRRPWIAFGILTYFLTLSIVSNVFFPVGTLVSERFLFFPSIGFCVVLAFLGFQSSKGNFLNSKVILGVLLAVIGLYSYKTVTRNAVWSDNYTLFTTDVQHEPNSAKLQNAAAGSKVDRFIALPEAQQELPKNQQLLAEAIEHGKRVTDIHPTYKQAYVIRGTAYLLAKDFDAAAADFDRALTLDPGYEDASEKLLLTYRRAGQYYGEKMNDLSRSREYLDKALQLRPNDYEALRLSAVLNGVGGRKQEAIRLFLRAAEVQPGNADAWWNLGAAYYQNGQVELANQQFEKARQIDPGIQARRQGG